MLLIYEARSTLVIEIHQTRYFELFTNDDGTQNIVFVQKKKEFKWYDDDYREGDQSERDQQISPLHSSGYRNMRVVYLMDGHQKVIAFNDIDLDVRLRRNRAFYFSTVTTSYLAHFRCEDKPPEQGQSPDQRMLQVDPSVNIVYDNFVETWLWTMLKFFIWREYF